MQLSCTEVINTQYYSQSLFRCSAFPLLLTLSALRRADIFSHVPQETPEKLYEVICKGEYGVLNRVGSGACY